MTDRILMHRETGLRKILTITRRTDGTAVDCTDCTATAMLRDRLGEDVAPILSLSTDTPPVDLESGMEWVDEEAGQLRIVIGEEQTRDTALFPYIDSRPWEQRYYLDVIVRDSDGTPKMSPIILNPVFCETATLKLPYEYTAEALALFAAMTTAPEEAFAVAFDIFIRSLIANDIWDDLDLLQIYAAGADEQAALLNWRYPGQNTGVPHGAPVFTPHRGYAFNGIDQYIDTNFIPSVHGVAMQGGGPVGNAMLGVYERANVASSTYSIGGDVTSKFRLMTRSTGSGFRVLVFNGAANFGSSLDSRGLILAQREADDTLSVYRNGALAATSATAHTTSALETVSTYVGANNQNGVLTLPRATNIGAAFLGARLSLQKMVALNAAVQTLMTTLGANV